MDKNKRESTPQEQETNILERYADIQGAKELLRETEAALMDAALTLKCEEAEKDEDDIRKYGLYPMSSESLARAALLLDVVSMAFEDAETRAVFEERTLDKLEFKILQAEQERLFRKRKEVKPVEDQ